MDDALVELIHVKEATRQLRFKNLTNADLEIERDGQIHSYTLKPLDQLFAQGTEAQSIDIDDDDHLALLCTIEQAILLYDQITPGLTDGKVLLALRSLAMNPTGGASGDPLAGYIDRSLRLSLSFNDYSRNEVKLAIRKVLQSVQGHNRESGVRGYLSFIREYVPAF